MFLRTGEVPDMWKMDMSQILDSSSSDDEEKESEEEDEEETKKKKRIKEEVRAHKLTCLLISRSDVDPSSSVCAAGGGGARSRGERPLPAAAL